MYTLSETNVTGYTAAAWNCTGTGVRPTGSTVTLDEGAVVSCAITNSDVAPTLALNKTVANNSGGDAVENDFVLSATPTTGAVITDAGGDVPATAAVANRVYTLAETNLDRVHGVGVDVHRGRRASDRQHRDARRGRDRQLHDHERDVAPTLALNKTVINSYGGNAVENDFVLSATRDRPDDDHRCRRRRRRDGRRLERRVHPERDARSPATPAARGPAPAPASIGPPPPRPR